MHGASGTTQLYFETLDYQTRVSLYSVWKLESSPRGKFYSWRPPCEHGESTMYDQERNADELPYKMT